METGPQVADSEAQRAKEEGNHLFRQGLFNEAVEKFSQAISLDPNNEVYYANRSLVYFSLKEWQKSLEDGIMATKINKEYVKAHYRVVKAYVELKKFREAKGHLLYAITQCGEKKELTSLESELQSIFGFKIRPKAGEFEIVEELGEGNFTKIYKAKYKPNGRIYAVKVRHCDIFY